MPDELSCLAGEFEAILPLILRQLYHVDENEPLGDLPLMQFRVVKTLFPERKPVSTVAKELHMSASRLAHLLARLEDGGLVVRLDDENDRRIRYAELTPHGVEMMTKRRAMRRNRARRLLEGLSSDERAQVMATLTLLVERSGALGPASVLEPDFL